MAVGKTKRRRAGKKAAKAGYEEYQAAKQEDDIDVDLLAFIAEEFSLWEHVKDCPVRQVLWEDLSEQEKFIQKAIKKPGALRSYFGVKEGEEIPVAEARAKYSELQKKAEGDKKLSESEATLFKRLNLFLKVLKPISKQKEAEEAVEMDPSNTAKALASFTEAAHTGGVGDLHPTVYQGGKKTRGDRKEYPTELRRAAAGKSYDSGKPKPAKEISHKARYEKGADPIGEDEINEVSQTAQALASFMEAAKHTGQAGDMSPTPYWGEKKTRSDNKEDYVKTGEEPYKSYGRHGDWDPSNKGESKPRYEKGADPLGGATSKQITRP